MENVLATLGLVGATLLLSCQESICFEPKICSDLCCWMYPLVIDALQTGNTRIFVLNLVIAILALLAGYFAKKARG